jgi:ankyrin repeat protein
MTACQSSETDTVALLLDRGANLEAKDHVRIPEHSTIFQSMSS